MIATVMIIHNDNFYYGIRKYDKKLLTYVYYIQTFALPYHELINRKFCTPRQKTIIYDTF